MHPFDTRGDLWRYCKFARSLIGNPLLPFSATQVSKGYFVRVCQTQPHHTRHSVSTWGGFFVYTFTVYL